MGPRLANEYWVHPYSVLLNSVLRPPSGGLTR